jgi:single-strand DNA-binding protein
MNRTSIIGNIGQDAQVRTLESGQAAISFSLAHTERWTDKQGNKQEKTEWINCTIWRASDKTSIAQYLLKGTKLLVEGRASARAWVTEQGEPRGVLELRVDHFEFLSSVQQQQQQASAPTTATEHYQQAHGAQAQPAQPVFTQPNPDDDLPF